MTHAPMTHDEIRAVLTDILGGIAPETDATSVAPDADLREAMDLDSMDFLNLVAALHERLEIDIPESEYRALSTIGGAIDYLAGRLAC